MHYLIMARLEYLEAEIALYRQHQSNHAWHYDGCCCDNCNAIRRWNDLTWWQKRKAKRMFDKMLA